MKLKEGFNPNQPAPRVRPCRLCKDLCEEYIAHCLIVWICLGLELVRISLMAVINQRRVEKSAFEDQSEEKSVWILKCMTLLGTFCKISFTPAVTSCYHEHALNADAHLSAH